MYPALPPEPPSEPEIPRRIEEIIAYAPAKHCPGGKELIGTGEEADCFYYVESGTFEVSYQAQQTPIVVAMIGAGAFFGEVGFFDQLPRTRNIRALDDAQLRVFDKTVMDRLHENDPALYRCFLEFLLKLVSRRFRQILSDRGPLTAYAASLSTGKEHFKGLQMLPADLLGSSGWQAISQQIEGFKAAMFDVAYQLQKDVNGELSEDLQRRGEEVLDELKIRVRQFGPEIEQTDHADLLWGYVFKEVFPYLMRSRFAERAYYKPKGYAGDFMMIELIYRQQAEGDGKLGRLIDGWALNQVPPRAVRARRRLLGKLIDDTCRGVYRLRRAQGPPMRLMNLACGSARELFDIINVCDYSDRIEAICIDIDPEALQFANQHVNTGVHQASVKFMTENVIKWSMGRVAHDFGLQDLIYSSGLCDYLDDRLLLRMIKRCYEHLNPGGTLIIGNFSTSNPDRFFMDYLLYWRLIHRDEAKLRDLFSQTGFGRQVDIVVEEEGLNLFAVARRP
jgi:extracellular factor (EF) 3-hydroxypalmitic acid methyl ester biosynthesis protein